MEIFKGRKNIDSAKNSKQESFLDNLTVVKAAEIFFTVVSAVSALKGVSLLALGNKEAGNVNLENAAVLALVGVGIYAMEKLVGKVSGNNNTKPPKT